MIRKKSKDFPERIIDLTGPQGNAYYLLALANTWMKQCGYTDVDREAVLTDMKSSDYEHLIQVFDKQFGSFVILER